MNYIRSSWINYFIWSSCSLLDILHLVTHALLKNIEDKPPGMKIFYEALSDVNIPEYLIANKMGKLIIAGRGDELSWRPPG